MADRPIIFSAPMIRALLAGRKTQTRRILKPQPKGNVIRYGWDRDGGASWTDQEWNSHPLRFWAGDRLWVKENHRLVDCTCDTCRVPGYVYFEADGDGYEGARLNRLRPSIHMPRWASRLTLLVTDVRVERPQDISEGDAVAEGVELESADPPFYYVPGIWPHSLTAVGVEEPGGRHAARSFAKLWGHINGAESWAANPWVVAVSFSVHARNIDQLAPADALGIARAA